ncbi:hypothetical protein Rhe02_54620 [Rhizocola hellebori]|uniref:Uncharacterized protein n=1 Tax=Rhizocola hellebori TaxID=1392758 RepID=A0A8J3QB98_9ACTN|nr:hypothetical protein [Rhizocola hellebori]GIH07395.1 hypothetical protein Rhe02_54620 [Rhizocola hellebori]
MAENPILPVPGSGSTSEPGNPPQRDAGPQSGAVAAKSHATDIAPACPIMGGGPSYDARREPDGHVMVWLKDNAGHKTWLRLSPADAVELGDAIAAVGRESTDSWFERTARWADQHPVKLWLAFWAVLVPLTVAAAVMIP